MSLIFSPVTLTSSRITSLVFHIIQRRKNLWAGNTERDLTYRIIGGKSIQANKELHSYFLALRGVILNGGPGGPKDLGNKSTHICNRPWELENNRQTWHRMKDMTKQRESDMRECFSEFSMQNGMSDAWHIVKNTLASFELFGNEAQTVLPALCQAAGGCRGV